MDPQEISACLADGSITYAGREDQAKNIAWNEHPKFPGVFLKHLIKGVDTDGRLSCHLVKINPHAVLAEHMHENQWELHEVIAGEGKFLLNSQETSYRPGCMAIIPQGTNHKVIAGKNGLFLLAKFFPALL
jgi:quercetin dioxygenase-like cupin family protein